MHRCGGGVLYTNGRSAGVKAVLNKLFANGIEVDNNLSRLDLVDGAALDGLDSGHVRPRTPTCVAVQVMTRRRDEE
jgi:hypothetical protein